MDKKTISITLWGDGLKKGKWLEWYEYICSVIQKMEYDRTHLAITSDVYTTSKIVTVRRKEKQVLQLLKDGAQPTAISIFSLLKDYAIASFDYNIMAVRDNEYISFIFNKYDLDKIDVNDFVSNMKEYIQFDRGEVYQMDRNEVPLIYAAQANSIDSYQTLEVIERF